LNALDPVTSLVNKYVGPVLGGLACPQLGQFDNVSSASAALSRDVRKAFTNASDLCRASLISSLAATTTRLGPTPTTSKCSEGRRGELVSLQKSARLCRGYYSGIRKPVLRCTAVGAPIRTTDWMNACIELYMVIVQFQQ
jgi:hypothetical protein